MLHKSEIRKHASFYFSIEHENRVLKVSRRSRAQATMEVQKNLGFINLNSNAEDLTWV